MSSLSIRVLELFDENRLSFDETEKLLRALSSHALSNITFSKKRNIINQTVNFIPPYFPSYMSGYTLENHN